MERPKIDFEIPENLFCPIRMMIGDEREVIVGDDLIWDFPLSVESQKIFVFDAANLSKLHELNCQVKWTNF